MLAVMTGNRFDRYKPWVPWLLGALATVLVLTNLGRPGLTWDEPVTVVAGYRYASALAGGDNWHEAWAINHEHPPAAKVVYGLFVLPFSSLDPTIPARLASAMMFGLLVVVTFKLAARLGGWTTGLGSAIVIATLPRLVGHAHVAALDLPMTLAWTFATYCFVRGLESRAWAIGWGLALGLAGLTKVNAPLVPLVLVPWGLVFYKRKAVPNLVALLIGPVVFFALWPWMHQAPVEHFTGYVRTVTARSVVPVYYLGQTWTSYNSLLLSTYPLVMTVLTVPVAWLVAVVLGLSGPWKTTVDRSAALRWLCVFTIGIVLVMQSLPGTPKYDGIRIFMPIFPFVACLAGLGLARLVDWCRRGGNRIRLVVALLVLLGVAPALLYGPWGMSYYNALVGFSRGARAAGFEVTYWGEGVDDRLLDHLEARCRQHPGRVPVRFVSVGHATGAWHYPPDAPRAPVLPVEGERWLYLVASARRGNFESHASVLRQVGPDEIVYTRMLFEGTPFEVPLATVYRHP